MSSIPEHVDLASSTLESAVGSIAGLAPPAIASSAAALGSLSISFTTQDTGQADVWGCEELWTRQMRSGWGEVLLVLAHDIIRIRNFLPI